MSAQLSSPEQTLKHIQQLISQSDFAAAQRSANELLEQTNLDLGSKVMCWYLLGVSFRLQKNHQTAIEAIFNLLKLNPQHARAQQELGYNYRALGQGKQASIHFYRASKLNPALLSAWQALLPIYKEANQKEAYALCQKQIEQLRALPQAILSATDLMHDGKIAEADILCRRYLQAHKHSLEGLLLLSEIAIKLKATSEAEFILETCVELAPTSVEAKYELFKVYSKLGKFAKALSVAETLVSQDGNNTFYQLARATALVGIGELDPAISIYQDIIANNKAVANVYLLLGHALKTQGNIKDSVAAYQKAYQLEAYCGDAYWSLANTKTYQFTADEIRSMKTGTKSAQASASEKVHLHFALGKAYEDQQKFDDAFFHYQAGNELQRASISYSSKKHAHFTAEQIATFTPNLVEKIGHLGHPDKAPIFIVGMPRAGSTLLEQILASHSQVDGTMELHEILGLAATLSKKQGNKPVYPKNLIDIPSQYFAEFGKRFIEDTKVYRQGAAFFIDKMPNNYMHIGLIKLILPNAKIIDARRNPMACCFSGFKQLFGEGQEFSYSLDDIALYYQNYVKLMDHWQTLFSKDILLVQHEDIVASTESQIKRILDFCGLPFEQSCVDFHKNKRAVKTPSAQQVRQPIYKSGLEQWKHFEANLGTLKSYFPNN
jgi:tetratricopeptide (TPR) repeat protein